MTTANKITMVRVALIPVFIGLMYWPFPGHQRAALLVFVLASATDALDGYIARHYNQITDFGKFMDPMADKILVISALLIFVERGRFPAWALCIVLAREFAVSGLRLVAAGKRRVIAAAWSGKIKTGVTMLGICVMLLLVSPPADRICCAAILVTTVWSGAEYFIKNRDCFGDG